MIKVTYLTNVEGASKPEKTSIRILPGRYYVQYDVPGKAEATVKKMKEDGRRNVLFSRGVMIQTFPNKTEKEILEIVKKDIENGIIVAEEKTKRKPKITDLVIEEK